jgi:hypothetical protein
MGCETSSGFASLLQRISSLLEQSMIKKVCNVFFCFTRQTKGEFPIKAYTVWELAKEGIKFTSFSMRSPHTIRFEKYSHVIYLPRMTISYLLQTEVFFRNLLALEFVDVTHQNTLTTFVKMMELTVAGCRHVGR